MKSTFALAENLSIQDTAFRILPSIVHADTIAPRLGYKLVQGGCLLSRMGSLGNAEKPVRLNDILLTNPLYDVNGHRELMAGRRRARVMGLLSLKTWQRHGQLRGEWYGG